MKNRNIDKHDDWETPESLYQDLNKKYNFDFDPCPIYYEFLNYWFGFDGLNVKWGERNFINPPYSRKLKEAFIKKAYYESTVNKKLCVLLLPVSTSTKIFHEYIYGKSEITFLKGRVKFEGINTFGEKVSNKYGMHDSMIVVYKGD